MGNLFKGCVLWAGLLLGLAAGSANAVTVAPGDIIKVDNFSGINYPYLASGLLFALSPNTLIFDYSVFDGAAPSPVTTGSYSGGGIFVNPLTLQNATAYVLLFNFNGIGDISGGLYAPEVCAEVLLGIACTPIRIGQITKISAVPLPTALPLFAVGLGAMGLMARRRKRTAGMALKLH